MQRWLLFPLFALTVSASAATSDDVRTTWRLIDYLAVDYAEAVDAGEVVNPEEYGEMTSFAEEIHRQIGGLPAGPERDALLDDAVEVQSLVGAKAPPETVRRTARRLAASLLEAHPVPLAPSEPPDLVRGASLFAEHCASCHGATGGGDGPASAGMEPPPIDFTDRARAVERSPFALYQVVDQGLEGTPMTSFHHLPDADRWAVAWYASTLAFPETLVEEGRERYAADAQVRARLPDLTRLASVTPMALRETAGAQSDAVTAYLRRHPDAVQSTEGRLGIAHTLLRESREAFEAGDTDRARDLAIAFYLDGIEPLEPGLATVQGLVPRVEAATNAYRASLAAGSDPAVLREQVATLDGLLDEVGAALDEGPSSPWAIFVAALLLLLREGTEAVLVVTAMVAALRKAERPELLSFLHAGWIGALVAGGLTWGAAATFLSVSGASREVLEGGGAALAAIVLLAVGVWMHDKSLAGRWQGYVREKLGYALRGRSAWALTALAFVVVYREVFETILFYTALWAQAGATPVIGGLVVGGVLLAALTAVLLSAARSLPIGPFFGASALLMGALSVILAGKGVHGLQEAGLVATTPAPGPHLDLLGVYPTLQSLAGQGGVLLLWVAGLGRNFLRR